MRNERRCREPMPQPAAHRADYLSLNAGAYYYVAAEYNVGGEIVQFTVSEKVGNSGHCPNLTERISTVSLCPPVSQGNYQ
jgi:hypothetical protein